MGGPSLSRRLRLSITSVRIDERRVTTSGEKRGLPLSMRRGTLMPSGYDAGELTLERLPLADDHLAHGKTRESCCARRAGSDWPASLRRSRWWTARSSWSTASCRDVSRSRAPRDPERSLPGGASSGTSSSTVQNRVNAPRWHPPTRCTSSTRQELGLARGIGRDNGGHAVALEWSIGNIYGVRWRFLCAQTGVSGSQGARRRGTESGTRACRARASALRAVPHA